jgi:hypothetical protein
MKSEHIADLVSKKFAKNTLPEPAMPPDDGVRIEDYFGCSMRALIGIYRIEGDHMPAEEMIAAFEAEKEINPTWEDDLIPFYAIGNGDYLCFRKSECPNSGVYFIPHDEARITKTHSTFSHYLNDPKWFY